MLKQAATFCRQYGRQLFALLCVVLLAWWLVGFANCEYDYSSAYQHATHVNQAIFNRCFARGSIGAIGRLWIYIVRHHDAFYALVTTISTMLIAWFTGTLWWAAAGQYDLLAKQIKLASDEFNATHRPKIRVRFFPELPLKKDEPLVITYEAVNIGDAEATIIKHELSIYDFFDGETSDPIWSGGVPVNKEKLMAGEASPRYQIKPTIPTITKFGHAAIPPHSIADMWVRGFFQYSDVRGIVRKTQFLRHRDNNSLALRPDPDADRDYEYED